MLRSIELCIVIEVARHRTGVSLRHLVGPILDAFDVQEKGLHNRVCLLGVADVLLLLIDAHALILTRVLDLLLELQKLLEGVVEEHDLCRSLLRQRLTDFLEALRTSEQFFNESLDLAY